MYGDIGVPLFADPKGSDMKLIYRCLCVVLGAILGAGCDSDDGGGGPSTRSATVRIDGQAVDVTDAPLPGIHVAFEGDVADTTDAAGHWSIEARGSVPGVCVDDVDAPCMIAAHEVGFPDGNIYFPYRESLDLVQTQPGGNIFDLGLWEQHDIRVVLQANAVLYGPPCAARAWLRAAKSGPA